MKKILGLQKLAAIAEAGHIGQLSSLLSISCCKGTTKPPTKPPIKK